MDVEASASGAGESLTIPHDETYAQTEKRRASQKAYEQSDKRKAYAQSEKERASRRACVQSERGKAYAQSEKGRVSKRAWAQSERGRAYQKAYQKIYQKAYHKVLWDTGDKEQAKIAGKQATAPIRESTKAKRK
ncbi:hypothetical protein [Endozoicomonas sp. GU-1]|uniref:hypothetical protein n=1 Tax=Endozoicomonas sp. GU-1 TaxID=3009078 RepID=UPI0022B4F82C|nr:hypothetical protein [Endozoicomonas sp. GU-1]WBA82361.1 hypothetical protein O2T12_04210 [Endozoicomonas sp. GU-1]